MKWFFVIPPVLVGLTSYIGLRRLGYQPMRKWLVPHVGGLTAVRAVQSAAILFMPGWVGPPGRPHIVQLVVFPPIPLVPIALARFPVFRPPEVRGRKGSRPA